MLFIREPAVPRRIVQKVLAELQARRIAPLERAMAVRQVLDSGIRTFAAGGRLWATFATVSAKLP